MRKVKIMILCFIVLMSSILFNGCGLQTESKIEFKIKEDGTSMLKRYKGTSQELSFTVPDYDTEGNVVNELGEFSIANGDYINTITIGQFVTTIHDYAIVNNPRLQEIIVHEDNPNFKSIDGVLYTKDEKTILTYPNHYKSYKAEINGKLEDRSTYVIPDGVEVISANAFYKCSALQFVTIPDSVKVIEDRAFMKSTNLEKVRIPNNLESIGEDAFSFLPMINYVYIPESVTSIGNFAFFGCSSLKQINLQRASLDGMTVAKNWLPIRDKSISKPIDILYSQERGD